MNFSVERPESLLAVLLLVPAVAYSVYRYVKIVKTLGEHDNLFRGSTSFSRLKFAFVSRTVCRSIAWIFLVCAFAGISIGTNSVPVQKNGRSVAMVMDISYSMETRDAPQGMTRLEAVASYADELLKHLDGCTVSVVLAKGEGILAVPVTEDYESIRALLYSLSPSLMTSAGSNLGSGIDCALNSFPEQSAAAPVIWLFTDGEETDDNLSSSLNEAVRSGVPVAIIGFGSERETEITAGDGKTRVKTALRSDRIERIVSSVQKRNSHHGRNYTDENVMYVDASEMGSARKLLKMLKTRDGGAVVSYELKPIPRYAVFTLLAIVFFLLSFACGEFSPALRSGSVRGVTGVSLVLVLLSFTGCTSRVHEGTKLLEGRLDWNRKEYPNSVATFLNIAQDAKKNSDQLLYDYAVFALASTYLSQEEGEAALLRYAQISPSSPDRIRFAVAYNSGIIAHQKGDYEKAVQFFREAVSIDSTSIDAKINLELSIQEQVIHSKSMEQELTPVAENKDDNSVENAIYSVIRENDRQQWKNQEQPQELSARDY